MAQLWSTYISPVSLFHALWLVDGSLLMPLPATCVLHSLLVVFTQPLGLFEYNGCWGRFCHPPPPDISYWLSDNTGLK